MVRNWNKRTDGKFCQCEMIKEVVIDDDEWKVWYVCTICGKKIFGTDRYWNHYDGEDHLEPDSTGLDKLLKLVL